MHFLRNLSSQPQILRKYSHAFSDLNPIGPQIKPNGAATQAPPEPLNLEHFN